MEEIDIQHIAVQLCCHGSNISALLMILYVKFSDDDSNVIVTFQITF